MFEKILFQKNSEVLRFIFYYSLFYRKDPIENKICHIFRIIPKFFQHDEDGRKEVCEHKASCKGKSSLTEQKNEKVNVVSLVHLRI